MADDTYPQTLRLVARIQELATELNDLAWEGEKTADDKDTNWRAYHARDAAFEIQKYADWLAAVTSRDDPPDKVITIRDRDGEEVIGRVRVRWDATEDRYRCVEVPIDLRPIVECVERQEQRGIVFRGTITFDWFSSFRL